MAFGRRFWRSYYRNYYRGRRYAYKRRGALTPTRAFKRSAANMTQGGTFNISVRDQLPIDIPAQASDAKGSLDLANLIKNSRMHKLLGCVFDQYRVERVSLKLRFLGDAVAALENPFVVFSVVDRSGFANNITMPELRSYSSYKETSVGGDKGISPVHYVNVAATGLEWSTYTDTKNAVTFPAVMAGVAFSTALNSAQNTRVYFSVELDCQIRYRGVRIDTTDVNITW